MCNSSNGNGGGDGGGEEWEPCAKKLKQHQPGKPRQRGLGVAKLEKILREQKDKEENKVAIAEFSSRLLSALPPQYQTPSSSFIRPAPPPVTTLPPMATMSLPSSTTSVRHAPFGPSPYTLPVLYGNAGMPLNSGVGVSVGGGAGVFAEPATAVQGCACFRSSREATYHGEGLGLDPRIEVSRVNAASTVLPREQDLHPSPTVMNPSPLSAAWSASFSAGRNHHIEHPSTQRPYADCSFIRPEEQKMVGIKRSCPFSNDQHPRLYHPARYPADIQKSYQLPSCGNGSSTAIVLEPGKTVSREVNRSSHVSGLNSKKCCTGGGNPDGGFLSLGPPGQTSKMDLSGVNLLPFLGHMEGQSQRCLATGRSIHQKPLHNFSREGHRDRKVASLSFNDRGDEAEDDNIDLELKL